MPKILKTIRRSPAVLVLILGLGLSAGPVPASPSADGVFAIKNVRLFDGERVIPSAVVVVRAGRIAAAGPDASIPDGAEIIDGSGKTLLPGLIDAHVHVSSAENLKQCLAFGVTAVVDMFMPVETLKAIKTDQFSAAPPLQAFLVSPATLVTVPGGHGTQFMPGIPVVTPETDLQVFVDARIAEGADFIKLIQEDFSAYGLKRPTLSNAQVAGLVRAAHKRGKIAVIHAALLRNCEDALAAGVDGLAHLYFENKSDPEFGRLAARHKAFVIPTLSVVRALNGLGAPPGILDDAGLKDFLKPEDIQGFQSSSPAKSGPGAYEAAEGALRQLRDAGVPLLAGTDAPNPGTAFGAALHGELELLVKAGLSPLEALRAATSAPADKFPLGQRGRVRAGGVADLVLVEGDPTADIKATRNIAMVWKAGGPVDREAYKASVREAAAARKHAPVPNIGPDGLVSDFESGKIEAAFGAGWLPSTDAFSGGKSTAKMEWAEGGAGGSRGAMKLTGEVREGASFPWAGAMFSPGKSVFSPTNLSAAKSIVFRAKGDARMCGLEIFAQSRGYVPVYKLFAVGAEWKDYRVTFEELGLDGADIMMIFFGAVRDPGPFTLFIDDIHLK